ncbi:SPOSA6832_01076, partial [Sporobolomyces salmonicolor]
MSKYASLPDIVRYSICPCCRLKRSADWIAFPSPLLLVGSQDTGADVFETPDVPLEHAYSRDSDTDDEYLPRNGSPTSARRGAGPSAMNSAENLDRDRLDAAEARRRFGQATLAAGSSSGDIKRELDSRPRRRLPWTSEYTAGAAPNEQEKETPLERLRRLRSEVAELEDEVRRSEVERSGALAAATEHTPAAEQDKDNAKGKKREVSPAVILQQLQMLRGDLQSLEPNLQGVLEANGEKEPDAQEVQGQLERKAKASAGLLSRLGLVGAESSTPVAEVAKGAVSPTSSQPTAGKEGELEKRLAELEKVVGASEADIDEVRASQPSFLLRSLLTSLAPLSQTNAIPLPLVQTVSRLDHLLTLLAQPRHLDSISRRVKVLVSDLERIHESRRKLGDTRPLNIALSGGMTLSTGGADGASASRSTTSLSASTTTGSAAASLPPDALQKIDALFSLLPRLDPLLPLAPRLLTRLRSLSALHASAASFSESVSSLKDEVSRLGEGEKGLKEVLDGLEGSIKDNEGRMKGNLQGLEKRLEEVVARLDSLGVQ